MTDLIFESAYHIGSGFASNSDNLILLELYIQIMMNDDNKFPAAFKRWIGSNGKSKLFVA